MRIGPQKGRVGALALAGACLIAMAVPGRAASGKGDGSAAGQPQGERTVVEPAPAQARTLERFLSSLWAAGFFRRNEAVRLELLDNVYAFFGKGSPEPPKGSKGQGCFSRGTGGKDTIFLRKDLFAYFEVGMEGVVEYPSVSRRVLPVLVHEICHDLWMNILDERERAAFSREAGDFMEEYRMAQTPEERQRFLRLAGDDVSGPRGLPSYAGFDSILATHPPRTLLGNELFAWFAERMFTTKARIPKTLRKYYSCVLAEVAAEAAETPR